jgi:hypothetical protein
MNRIENDVIIYSYSTASLLDEVELWSAMSADTNVPAAETDATVVTDDEARPVTELLQAAGLHIGTTELGKLSDAPYSYDASSGTMMLRVRNSGSQSAATIGQTDATLGEVLALWALHAWLMVKGQRETAANCLPHLNRARQRLHQQLFAARG